MIYNYNDYYNDYVDNWSDSHWESRNKFMMKLRREGELIYF